MRRALISTLVLIAIVSAFIVLQRSATPLPAGTIVDRVVVDKSDRTLTLYRENRPLRTYKVALGRQPAGSKAREGDDRTPEGLYRLDYRNSKSRYHLALHVSYPGAADVQRARSAGYAPGGDVMVHGIRRGFGWIGPLHRVFDWTHGCIAVTDGEVDEIGRAVRDGTLIEIRP